MEIDVTRGLFNPAVLDESSDNILDTNSYDSGYKYCGGYTRVRAAIFADQVLDYRFVFSQNATDEAARTKSYATVANEGDAADVFVSARYVKLVVDNNSGADTTDTRILLEAAIDA